MRMYLKTLWKLLVHKWFVFLECCRLGIPLLGLLHDWTKFLPSEFVPYARWFYGRQIEVDARLYPSNPRKGDVVWYNYLAGGPGVGGPGVTLYVRKRDGDILYCSPMSDLASFDRAWNHHQKANRHHWQYWVLVYDDNICDGNLLEALAEQAHRSWSGWMHYLFDRCSPQDDGTTVIPAPSVSRWVRQMNTPYAKLPENEKTSDRHEAIEYRTIFQKHRKLHCLPMPDRYRKEMLADWIGAGRAYDGAKPVLEWYLEHRDDMLLHPKTKAWIEEQLGIER